MTTRLTFRDLWESPTITTWVSLAISSLKSLVFLPLVVTVYSTAEVATWFLFLSAIAISNLFDLGFYSAGSRLVSYIMAGQNRVDGTFEELYGTTEKKINLILYSRLYGTYGIIFVVLCLVFFFALITLGTYTISNTINETQDPSILWNSWIVVIISMICNVYGKKYKTFLHGMNKISLMNRWNTLFGILTLIGGFIVLKIELNIFWFVFMTQIFVILSALRDKFLLINSMPVKSKIPRFYWDKELFMDVWKPTWRTGLGILGSSGITEASGFIYAQYTNPGQLASYLLALRIMNFVSTISKAPFYSKLPIYNKLRAENKLAELSEITKKGIILSLLVFSITTSLLAIFTEIILIRIGSNVEFVSLVFWFFMSLVWFIDRNDSMHAQIYSTTNKIPFYITISITGIINILLLFLLIEEYGIWTFVISTAIANLVINNWWNVKISLESLNQNIRYLYKTLVLPIFLFLMLFSIAFLIKG